MKIVEEPLSALLFPTKLNELVEDVSNGTTMMVGLTEMLGLIETEGGCLLVTGDEVGRFLPPRI
jgi:hypothetical protein